MNLELIDPFRQQTPDRIDCTLSLPREYLHYHYEKPKILPPNISSGSESKSKNNSEYHQCRYSSETTANNSNNNASNTNISTSSPIRTRHKKKYPDDAAAAAVAYNIAQQNKKKRKKKKKKKLDLCCITNSFNRRGSYIACGYKSGDVAIFDFLSRSLLIYYCPPSASTQPSILSSMKESSNDESNKNNNELRENSFLSWSRRSRKLFYTSLNSRFIHMLDNTQQMEPHQMKEDDEDIEQQDNHKKQESPIKSTSTTEKTTSQPEPKPKPQPPVIEKPPAEEFTTISAAIERLSKLMTSAKSAINNKNDSTSDSNPKNQGITNNPSTTAPSDKDEKLNQEPEITLEGDGKTHQYLKTTICKHINFNDNGSDFIFTNEDQVFSWNCNSEKDNKHLQTTSTHTPKSRIESLKNSSDITSNPHFIVKNCSKKQKHSCSSGASSSPSDSKKPRLSLDLTATTEKSNNEEGDFDGSSYLSSSISSDTNVYSSIMQLPKGVAVGSGGIQIHPFNDMNGLVCSQDGSLYLFQFQCNQDENTSSSPDDNNSPKSSGKFKCNGLLYPVVRYKKPQPQSVEMEPREGETKRIETPSYFVTCASFGKAGNDIYAGTKCGTILVFSLPISTKKGCEMLNFAPVSLLSKTSSTVNSSNITPTVKFKIPQQGNKIPVVSSITISPNGQYLLVNTSLHDSTLRLYHMNSIWKLHSLDKRNTTDLTVPTPIQPRITEPLAPSKTFQDLISKTKTRHWISPCFSSDSEYVVAGCNNEDNYLYEIHIWNSNSGILCDKLTGPPSSSFSSSLSSPSGLEQQDQKVETQKGATNTTTTTTTTTTTSVVAEVDTGKGNVPAAPTALVGSGGERVYLCGLSCHPTRNFIAASTSDGLVDVWGPPLDWKAFAPDFQSMVRNIEYIETEDEFDKAVVQQSDDEKESKMKLVQNQKVQETTIEKNHENNIDDAVDVVTIDKIPMFDSDSEDEEDIFHFETKLRVMKTDEQETMKSK